MSIWFKTFKYEELLFDESSTNWNPCFPTNRQNISFCNACVKIACVMCEWFPCSNKKFSPIMNFTTRKLTIWDGSYEGLLILNNII